jgi:membrane fusion protein, multidrug efflux system
MVPHRVFKRLPMWKHLLPVVSVLSLTCLVVSPVMAQSQSRTPTDPVATSLMVKDISTKELTARGVVRPWHEVKIAVDLVAKIKALPFRVGDTFKQGDVLLELDCVRFQADLRASKAAEAEHAAVHRTNVTLRQHRAAGSNEVEISKARLARASAEAESLGHRITQCKIEAPFAGRIAERMIDLHEMPQANQPLLRIVNDGALEVALIVPAHWLKWLKEGSALDYTLDDTGVLAKADVTRMGASVDPVSQTVEIFAKLRGATGHVLPGMSGTARFQPSQS